MLGRLYVYPTFFSPIAFTFKLIFIKMQKNINYREGEGHELFERSIVRHTVYPL
jgi:hypothetical protein